MFSFLVEGGSTDVDGLLTLLRVSEVSSCMAEMEMKPHLLGTEFPMQMQAGFTHTFNCVTFP